MKRQFFFACAFASLLVAQDVTSLSAQSNRTHTVQKRKKAVAKKSSAFPGQYPESSERALADRDVEHLTTWGMKVMLNEIYARHGFIFREADLKKHFRKEKWYRGKEREMNKIKLSDIEVQNIAFIRQQQQRAHVR